MAAKDVKDFNEWFNRSYARLKERISIYYGKIDEDVFHDAYLAVRKQVMFSREGIENWESYFFGCYRKMVQAGTRDNCRYSCPGDEYFITLEEIDDREETEEREEMLTGCDMLVRDIQKFLRRHFSYEDYRMFMLRFYETGSSFRTIARHMGEKTSVITRRAQVMLESVRANRTFAARRRMIAAGDAA
ncbi:sigma-70 family RNA polymerase sigma factor [Parabacteroides merdae]|uniref:sigma-70 family RNA polymerase sigma factor n=1 Tax=Parabacteroides merdae TaxID=46503 RepID=UPI0034A3FF61